LSLPQFQLYGPLNQLGYIYRSVNQSLVDTERLLALLNETTEINDKVDAPDLVVTTGEIEFGKWLLYHS
jgi:ATP-binding cassette subfamily B (MDR/TAP) protein 6